MLTVRRAWAAWAAWVVWTCKLPRCRGGLAPPAAPTHLRVCLPAFRPVGSKSPAARGFSFVWPRRPRVIHSGPMSAEPQFFSDQRLHFFRPLTGKYREQVMACLRALYARLYSSLADYSRVVQRDLVIEVFQETIARTPIFDDAEDEFSPAPRGE